MCLQRASNLCSASNSTVLTDLGHTLRATGQFQKASDAYRASVALGGELKGAGGASKQALTYFRAASGLVPSAPSSRVVGEADSEALRASMPKDMHRALSQVPPTHPPRPNHAPDRPPCPQVHMTDVASEAECGMLIALAEAAAAVRGGWTSEGHHKDFPTRDVVVSEVPEMAVWLNAALEAKIWPSLAAQFGVEASDLWLQVAHPPLGALVDDTWHAPVLARGADAALRTAREAEPRFRLSAGHSLSVTFAKVVLFRWTTVAGGQDGLFAALPVRPGFFFFSPLRRSCLQDCFLVRYDGDGSGQRGLGEHVDDSELSFNLLLSSPADFEGGGTR